jgi:hypothetical protein
MSTVIPENSPGAPAGAIPDAAKGSSATLTLKGLVQSGDPLLPAPRDFVLNYPGETDLIDFKEDFGGDEREWLELTKDILSFANTHGGYLVFGVKDGTHEKKGIEQTKAAMISDPSDVHAKVNRFVEPHITTLQCVAVMRPEDGRFYVFVHIPASKDRTHIVTKPGTFKDKSNKDVVALRVGEIYVRRVGWRGVVTPQDFEALLERRMENFKQVLFSRISRVVEAPADAKVLVVHRGEPEYENAEGVRLSSDPAARPVKGISTTVIPSTDEEELATFAAAFRKDQSHRPSTAFLYRLYERRSELTLPEEHVLALAQMSVLAQVPCIYWLRRLAVPSGVAFLEELARTAKSSNQQFNLIRLIAVLDRQTAAKMAEASEALVDFDRRQVTSAIRNGQIANLFGTGFLSVAHLEGQSTLDSARAGFDKLATEIARKLSAGSGDLTDRWHLEQLDAWLYSS